MLEDQSLSETSFILKDVLTQANTNKLINMDLLRCPQSILFNAVAHIWLRETFNQYILTQVTVMQLNKRVG